MDDPMSRSKEPLILGDVPLKRPVPEEQAERDRYSAEGWTLHAPFDGPAYMSPPKALADAFALRESFRRAETEALASLDCAWREAEAALPEGWMGPAVEPRWPNRWRAWVYQPWPSPIEPRSVFAESEADALRALASELRAHPGSIAECSRIE